MPRRLLSAAVFLLLLASCSRPQSREYFQRSDGSGEYSFDIEMSDSLTAYDISFYTAIDRPLFSRDTLTSFPLQIVWRSPSGRYFSETVYYPVGLARVPYRTGLVPSEPGIWNIAVTLPSEPRLLRGLGIVCRRASE